MKLLSYTPADDDIETRGPNLKHSLRVNHSPGNFLPTMSFEEWRAWALTYKHAKNKTPSRHELDLANIRRIDGLVAQFETPTASPAVLKALREIRIRLRLMDDSYELESLPTSLD